jgi:hypothetical protein
MQAYIFKYAAVLRIFIATSDFFDFTYDECGTIRAHIFYSYLAI